MYGYEKSSRMQDKILSRMDPREETERYVLPQRTWTPQRWAHRVGAKPTQPSVSAQPSNGATRPQAAKG